MCLCSMPHSSHDSISNNFKFNSERVSKANFEDSGDRPIGRCRNVLDDTENLTSTSCGCGAGNHFVITYEQIKKGHSLFYPEQKAESDGIHTLPLQLLTIHI